MLAIAATAAHAGSAVAAKCEAEDDMIADPKVADLGAPLDDDPRAFMT